MKAAWAKFSTSISPKISVRPDAIRNSIMPMVTPATVSVIQVAPPMAGSAANASSGTTSTGDHAGSLTGGRPG